MVRFLAAIWASRSSPSVSSGLRFLVYFALLTQQNIVTRDHACPAVNLCAHVRTYIRLEMRGPALFASSLTNAGNSPLAAIWKFIAFGRTICKKWRKCLHQPSQALPVPLRIWLNSTHRWRARFVNTVRNSQITIFQSQTVKVGGHFLHAEGRG